MAEGHPFASSGSADLTGIPDVLRSTWLRAHLVCGTWASASMWVVSWFDFAVLTSLNEQCPIDFFVGLQNGDSAGLGFGGGESYVGLG